MTHLDDTGYLRKIDRSNMLDILMSFPGQCRSAYELARMAVIPASFRAKYKNVVCTGLGGSAIGADIARSFLAGSSASPIFINRDYRLPAFVDSQTLLIVSSYSGNTEETLSAYKDGKSRRSKTVVITSGGRLKRLAYASGDPVMYVPAGFPPRAALGYSFFSVLEILSRLGVVPRRPIDIKALASSLENLRDKKIAPGVSAGRNTAKQIANFLSGKFPVIYSPQEHFDAVAMRWRGQLAENAKTLSSVNFFPEMNHNEIAGWQNPKKVLRQASVVMLKDNLAHPRVAKRMDITKAMLKSAGIGVLDVESSGRSLLERVFSLIYIGDFASFYLAMLNKVDPTSIDRITRLKEELSKI